MMLPRSSCTRQITLIQSIYRRRCGMSIRRSCAPGGRWALPGSRLTASTSPRRRVRHWLTGIFVGLHGLFCAGPGPSGRGLSSLKTSKSSRPGDLSARVDRSKAKADKPSTSGFYSLRRWATRWSTGNWWRQITVRQPHASALY